MQKAKDGKKMRNVACGGRRGLCGRIVCVAAFMAAWAPGAGAAANLLENGAFDVAAGWGGGPFDRGPGRFYVTNGVGRLEKDRGPGATQLLRNCPLGDAGRVKVSFRHRGAALAFAYGYELPTGKGGAFERVKNDAGGNLGEYVDFKGGADWTLAAREIAISPKVRGRPGARMRLQWLVWGGDAPRFVEIDDVAVEALPDKPVPPPPPPLAFTVERATKTIPYGPVRPVDPVRAEIRDGLLLKNGRPAFWAGNGTNLGSEQGGPMGTWLSKLQGTPALSICEGGGWTAALDGTNLTFKSRIVTPYVAQYREAERLGFLCDFFANGVYKWSPMRKTAEAHPDMKEFFYDHGHYMNTDPGHPVGRELQIGKRRAFFQYVNEVSRGADGMAVLELSREPGPEPGNARSRRDFRAWARRKYGTLDEANRVWRMDFASWDDVEPLHLRKTDVTGYMERILQIRRMRRDHRELIWDWVAFQQDDVAAQVANAAADVRRELPGMKVTVDVRGHNTETANYAALDPARIDPLEDLFYIHFGWMPFTYNDEPYDRASVLYHASFPLFSYNFFRTNTSRPIVNAEDIIDVARLPKSDGASMARNDIAGLHRSPWKFRLESAMGEGMDKGWFRPGLDDSAWDEMKVPGCWDETDAYRAKPGVAWYRRRFVARANRQDFEDGSHQFFLYGKGVAQKGTVWINGRKVGDVAGWDAPYRFDVGAILNFGGTNEIVWRVDGAGYQNGLRFYCHVLPHDKIGQTRPFGAREYRHMLWTYLMRGTSGCWVWPWHEDRLRLHLPGLQRRLDAAAEIALPDLRHRAGEVAFLYGYLSNLGLPCVIGETHERYLNWLCAMEFSGLRADVFGEDRFMRDVTPERYPFLVVPHTEMVRDETYAHFRRYVEAGGTAVLTEDSLTRTFSRYAATDVRAFAGAAPAGGAPYAVTRRGKGRVVVVRGEPTMETVMEWLAEWRERFGAAAVPDAPVRVASSSARERPLIERVLAGDDTRKVLYLANWGGTDHAVAVTLPEAVRGWTLAAQFEGRAARDADGTLTAVVPSQDVVALALVKPGADARPVMPFEPSPTRMRALAHVERLCSPPAQTNRGLRVLFPLFTKDEPRNKEIYPYVLDRIAAFGGVSEEAPLEDWSPELLAKYDLVVIPETVTPAYFRDRVKMERLGAWLDAYVRGGGSLFVNAHTPYSVNVYSYALTGWMGLAPYLGVDLTGDAYDESRAVFGDPHQVWTDEMAPGELTAGVRKVELYQMRTLSLRPGKFANPRAVVAIPPASRRGGDGIVLTSEERGRGRIVVNASAMSFQPFRIEKADNAALLQNVMGWLLRRDVTDAMRAGFRDNLFLTEETLRRIRAEDAPAPGAP